MGLTFDEAIKKLEAHDITKLFNSHTIIEIVKQLRQEYAPTVEMTTEQKDIIMNLLDDSDISQNDWKNMINDDSPELPKISYRQAIMAYNNPETIVVTDSE